MKRFAMLLCLTSVMASGCKKLEKVLNVTVTAQPITILVMGQSNAYYWPPSGVRAFYERYRDVNVVNCAVGGTSITQWTPNLIYYKTCIDDLRGKVPDLVFFWQGENDTGTPMGESWGYQASQTFRDLQSRYPHVKIVYAQLGANNAPQYNRHLWGQIQDEQAAISMSGVKMIVTKDLATDEFGTHMSQESYYTVGQRILLAMEEI